MTQAEPHQACLLLLNQSDIAANSEVEHQIVELPVELVPTTENKTERYLFLPAIGVGPHQYYAVVVGYR